jgi:(1->4)-alpha-D-glucan 1-alpha-D-glucosylmutase
MSVVSSWTDSSAYLHINSETHGTHYVPSATYRLQLTADFNFAAAVKVLPYLAELGVSHLYLSPIFKALTGSRHGYDTVDHSTINPELGGEAGFIRLASAAKRFGMGLVLDVVPNHMAVAADNMWWRDVLEHGPASKYADYFDIDWTPLRESMRNRLLLPVLGDHYGAELNRGALQLMFDPDDGSLNVRYADYLFPLDPQTYSFVFGVVHAQDTEQAHELQELLSEFERLPGRSDLAADRVALRHGESIALKKRLRELHRNNPKIAQCMQAVIEQVNGVAGKPSSFDTLAELLDRQPYRLAYWKVAGDEINYRRFFDVNQLAALRMENPDVFNSTHEHLLRLVAAGHVQGLRIDHVDGLLDPLDYLHTLRTALRKSAAPNQCYLVVEKILAAHERLREWPIDGTTGYEFGALIIGWLTAERGVKQLEKSFARFTHRAQTYAETVYRSKRLLMRTSLAAEIAVLAVQLDRIAQSHRDTRDYTQFALRDALVEVIASFPVYRTYVSSAGVDAEDERIIRWAIGIAKARDKGSDRSIFDFVESVLLCKSVIAETAAGRKAVLEFATKFQQVTAPVMAKSVEDTAFYRDCRLLSLNEVGSDPGAIKYSTTALHKENVDRARRFPHCMLATATHDSKRGEDVRYRLSVLTELVPQWRQFVTKASRLNRIARRRTADGDAPSRTDEYLLLQTAIGIWPASAHELNTHALRLRLKEYLIKAVREAKERTSWLEPDGDYERGLIEFVESYFSEPRVSAFVTLVNDLVQPVAFYGTMNALTAAVLKLTSPGVPDFYQGAELPTLTLVDPDNRRSIAFDLHRARLSKLKVDAHAMSFAAQADKLMHDWRSGVLKLWTNWRLLTFRSSHAQLFTHGSYEPLQVQGLWMDHVCAFARHHENQWLIVIVSRWTASLTKGTLTPPLGETYWSDTRVMLPDLLRDAHLLDVLCGTNVDADNADGHSVLYVSKAFTHLPVAVLFVRQENNRDTASPSK